MANKMIIDASHPEETRVVVLRGNRIEEFDFESANKKPLRGNIYLAKVTRVEPSLQAAFVEYGGNRHGFLAFSEIHPDYYQIPVADRQALLEDEARQQREEEDDEGRSERRGRRSRRHNHERAEKRTHRNDATLTEDIVDPSHEAGETEAADHEAGAHEAGAHHEAEGQDHHDHEPKDLAETGPSHDAPHHEPAMQDQAATAEHSHEAHVAPEEPTHSHAADAEHDHHEQPLEARKEQDDHAPEDHPHEEDDQSDDEEDGEDEEEEQIENLGGDDIEEMPARPYRSRRQYKIQEVIKRRQVLLVQVVKEERGNKGAALTTYLSLAGRYSVLMPNTARGGGISRKITELGDRKRLKSIVQELEVPEGMGIILRTAGASRTKPEIKRDFEYLLRMWETVREVTLRSTAPTLVYEEGSLIKRTIRDLYNKEIDDITVSGEAAFREARNFMRLLMPSHVKAVVPWREQQPVFARFGIESQLDAMFSSQVTLRSGGYIVINQTEALVAIDVNSGRSTREHNIEDTALRTNLEAADEVARQLRLRDLAGLIVVDFIDMEENRNNRAVERRLKEALKNDRARIQVGRISHFGLLEMSRQRMRPGVLEGSTIPCPHCSGSGLVRSKASLALHVLRIVEDALIKNASFNLTVRTPSEVALYILNQKRSHLREIERRFGVTIEVLADDTLSGTVFHALERGEPAVPPIDFETKSDVVQIDSVDMGEFEDEVEEIEDESDDEQDTSSAGDEDAGEGEQARGTDEEREHRRRRRRRRRGRGDRESSGIDSAAPQPSDDGLAFV
ncbi:MAG: Rne/Rng family ribonuclease, partial [Alphaproteobacteria bacterium]|nr:Rne/Rng family ribonuclease [Alphaproteobacteria bacterium]